LCCVRPLGMVASTSAGFEERIAALRAAVAEAIASKAPRRTVACLGAAVAQALFSAAAPGSLPARSGAEVVGEETPGSSRRRRRGRRSGKSWKEVAVVSAMAGTAEPVVEPDKPDPVYKFGPPAAGLVGPPSSATLGAGAIDSHGEGYEEVMFYVKNKKRKKDKPQDKHPLPASVATAALRHKDEVEVDSNSVVDEDGAETVGDEGVGSCAGPVGDVATMSCGGGALPVVTCSADVERMLKAFREESELRQLSTAVAWSPS